MKTNVKFLIGTGLLLLTSVVVPYQAKATSDFGTISIANPDNPSEGITIMDRNLGATSNDMTSKDSFGYHFQWGNNYGFTQGCFSEGCSDYVTKSSKDVESHGALWNDNYNNSGYYGTTFIKNYYVGYRNDGSYHNGLWGGIGDNPNNNWGAKQNNSEDRQGPCPNGYHVPSAGEWGLLAKYWGNTYAKDSLIDGGDGFYYISGDVAADFKMFFKLPYAGIREDESALIYGQGSVGSYWSSSPNGEAYPDDGIGESRIYVFNTYGIPRWSWHDVGHGLSIRCFKNVYEPTTIENSKKITLKPGLNTFSTPAILKSIQFSNFGQNIVFAKMEKGRWTGLEIGSKAFVELIYPLEGYLIRNDGTGDVIMTIEYDIDNSDSLVLSKNLDAGWNFLGVTTINNPFNNIASALATMVLDFTNGENTNLIQMGKTFINATKFMLGKAYAVFVNNPGTYGGVNNYGGNTYQCVSMDSANVTHTIKDGVITLKWDEIQGDFVDVAIYADDERGYISAGVPSTVSMKDKKFDYNIRWSGEHKFMLRNGCKNFYYTVNVNTSQAYTQELQDAYDWAYHKGLISESTIGDARLYDGVDNLELADIMNKFAENVLELQPNTSLVCDFGDLSSYMQGYDEETLNEYQNILTKSCHFGLIPRDEITSPAPIQDVKRAIFGTALSRALWGNQFDGGTPYYANHLNALKAAGIMNQIDNPEEMWEIKGYVLIMLMRVADNYSGNPAGVLTNDITETVEFAMDEINTKTVFSGTYTVLREIDNGYGKLSSISIRDYEHCEENCPISGKIQFCLLLNGEGYCGNRNNINTVRDIITFDEINLEKNEPITLRIDAKYAGISGTGTKNFNMGIIDSNGFITDIAMDLASIKIADKSNNVCGNGVVDDGENCSNCPIDLGNVCNTN